MRAHAHVHVALIEGQFSPADVMHTDVCSYHGGSCVFMGGPCGPHVFDGQMGMSACGHSLGKNFA